MEVMSFFEDHGDVSAELERIYKFRKEVQHVEREYLELRILLRDAEAALAAHAPAPGGATGRHVDPDADILRRTLWGIITT